MAVAPGLNYLDVPYTHLADDRPGGDPHIPGDHRGRDLDCTLATNLNSPQCFSAGRLRASSYFGFSLHWSSLPLAAAMH
jgi:hypothetical protein